MTVYIDTSVEFQQHIIGGTVDAQQEVQGSVRYDRNADRVGQVGEIVSANDVAVRIDAPAHLKWIERIETGVAVLAVGPREQDTRGGPSTLAQNNGVRNGYDPVGVRERCIDAAGLWPGQGIGDVR